MLAEGLEEDRKWKKHSKSKVLASSGSSGQGRRQARRLGLQRPSIWQTTGRWQLTSIGKFQKTNLQPDIILWSRTMKQVVLLKLTVPWEEWIEEAHVCKPVKHHSLILEGQQRGCTAWNLAVEVGCRGFSRQSLWTAVESLICFSEWHWNITFVFRLKLQSSSFISSWNVLSQTQVVQA